MNASSNEAEAPFPSIDQVICAYVVAVLMHTQGNLRQAAKILGVSRSTVYNWIRKYKIDTNKLRSAVDRAVEE